MLPLQRLELEMSIEGFAFLVSAWPIFPGLWMQAIMEIDPYGALIILWGWKTGSTTHVAKCVDKIYFFRRSRKSLKKAVDFLTLLTSPFRARNSRAPLIWKSQCRCLAPTCARYMCQIFRRWKCNSIYLSIGQYIYYTSKCPWSLDIVWSIVSLTT